MPARTKLLMVGLDAADCDYIESHLDELPAIAAFLAGRPLQRLSVEPLSGSVWSTFITGTTPDHHGVYHHMQWDPAAMRIRETHPEWIGEIRPFWRDLARRGASVAAFDVPFAFRGDTAGALEIANWGSHDLVDGFWCSDPAVRRRIESVAKRHPMGFEIPVRKSRRQLRQMLAEILQGIDMKAELALGFMRQADRDLFLVVFGETHRGGHIFWPEPHDPDSPIPQDALASIYRGVDAAFGRLVEAAGPDADIVLFALHGMAANHSQSHLSRPMLRSALGTGAGQAHGAQSEGFGLIRELRRRVPAGLQHWVARQVPTAVRRYVVGRELVGGLDWETTRAFALDGDVSGYWRLNVAGREARGCLAPEAVEAIQAQLAEAFSGFVTDDGAPVVAAVHFPAAEGSGARRHLLPDIVVEWNTGLPQVEAALHPALGRASGVPATGRSGNHRFTGFLAHRGPGAALIDHPPRHIGGLGDLAEGLMKRRSGDATG